MARKYLSQEETVKLIELLPSEDVENELMQGHDRLVSFRANKLKMGGNWDVEDLISTGRIGLLKAIRSYDSNKGIKFVTYAAVCIDNEIKMYFRKEKKHVNNFSLQEPLVEDESLSLEDLLASDENVEEEAIKARMVSAIRFGMSLLPEKNRRALELFYMYDKKQHEIAKVLHCSQSYASRIISKSLNMLRDMYNDGTILRAMSSGPNISKRSEIIPLSQSKKHIIQHDESETIQAIQSDISKKTANLSEAEAVDHILDIIFNTPSKMIHESIEIPTPDSSTKMIDEGGTVMHTDFEAMKKGNYVFVGDGHGNTRYALLRKMLSEIPSNPDVANVSKSSPHYVLRELVNELKDAEREIVTLKYFDKLKNAEIANRMNCSYSNVTCRDNQAIKKLHVRFIQKCPDYAQYVAHISAVKESSDVNGTKKSSAQTESSTVTRLGDTINSFLNLRYIENKELKDISEKLGVGEEILDELARVTEKMLFLQKEYWLKILADVVNGKCSATEVNMQLLMQFISGISKEDVSSLDIDENRMMLFNMLAQKLN